jgi:hypothetical protein
MTTADSPAPGAGRVTTTIREPRPTDSERGDDKLRHIICMACYPAFEGTREAPHDAVCICGKLIRKGDSAGPDSAQQCIVCNALRERHFETRHGDE